MVAFWVIYFLVILLLWYLFPSIMLVITFGSLAYILYEARNAPIMES